MATVNHYTQTLGKSNGSSRSKQSSLSFEDVMRLCEQGDKRAEESIDRMAYYLGLGTAMLVTSFAPKLIIFVGEATQLWHRIGPIIENITKERSPTATATKIIPLDDFSYPRLRGAVSLVLQKHFVAPSVA